MRRHLGPARARLRIRLRQAARVLSFFKFSLALNSILFPSRLTLADFESAGPFLSPSDRTRASPSREIDPKGSPVRLFNRVRIWTGFPSAAMRPRQALAVSQERPRPFDRRVDARVLGEIKTGSMSQLTDGYHLRSNRRRRAVFPAEGTGLGVVSRFIKFGSHFKLSVWLIIHSR